MNFDELLSQLRKDAATIQQIATMLGITLPGRFPTSVTKLNDCLDVYSATKAVIAGVVNDARNGSSIESLAKLSADFDSNWDKFAKEYNALFNNSTSAQQTNILETFARAHFGDAVFNSGSVIKNETPNILGGIVTFKNGVNAFKGSFRNPTEAAAKIKAGVDNIVVATEKIADSINNIYKNIKGKGNVTGISGIPVLDRLSQLHTNKLVAPATSAIHIGTSGIATAASAGNLINDIKRGDINSAITDARTTASNAKQLANDIKNFGKATPTATSIPATSSNSGINPSQSGTNAAGNQTATNDSQQQDNSNADSYVCSTATLKCSCGDKSAKLTVYPDRTVFLTGQPMANISDHISLYNIAAFGKCHTTAFPPTGSATAANHGRLTPMPCVPGTISEWMAGKNDVIVKGKSALLKSSYCRCKWGGIITITNDGQK